jgi:hypothetical protein
MPPVQSLRLAKFFKECLEEAANDILDAEVPKEKLYTTEGAGFIDYVADAQAAYDKSMLLTRYDNTMREDVRRTPNPTHEADDRSRGDLYLFFGATRFVRMTHEQFQVVLGLRFGVLPRWLHDPKKKINLQCACGKASARMLSLEMFIQHSLMCSSFAKYGPATRHNDLRDGLAAVARSYGFSVIVEPNIYVYDDKGGMLCRPDITFSYDCQRVTTDVMITYPSGTPGEKAADGAAIKIRKHGRAVGAAGDRFIPFVVETFGYRDPCCNQLARSLSAMLVPHMQRAFLFDWWSTVSCELARGRAKAVLGAYWSYMARSRFVD